MALNGSIFFAGGCSFEEESSRSRLRGGAAPLLPGGVGAGAGAGVTAGASAGAADSVLVPPHMAHARNAASASSWRYVQAGQAQGSAGTSIYCGAAMQAAGPRTHE